MNDYPELMDLIDKYAKAVGIDQKCTATAGGRIWAGRYAQIALCIVGDAAVGSLLSSLDGWQLKLDELLTKQEMENSTVIDGYLILAIPESPGDELRGVIRRVEMDTSICRKHVIWPEPGDTSEERWRRIFKVTALGLPPSPGLTKGADFPVLDGLQKIIWDESGEMGVARAAAIVLSKGII